MALTQRVRRDSTRVIFEILSLTSGGASKTQIIFKVNLSYQLAERYVHFLLNKGLLKQVTNSDKSTRYLLTEHGAKLLSLLREVEHELGDLFVRSASSESRIQDPVSPFSLGFGN
jgi:predicted transcriptional regulator